MTIPFGFIKKKKGFVDFKDPGISPCYMQNYLEPIFIKVKKILILFTMTL